MKKLDWYIIRQFLGAFFYTIMLFSAIAVVIDISERIDDFLENSAPLYLIITQYYANFVPYIVFLLAPLFIFISVIFFTSQLAYRSEMIAIFASGVNFYRILLGPYFFAALLLVCLQLFANHYWVPKGNASRIEFEDQYVRGKYVNTDRNIHIQIDKENYIYVESFNVRDTSGRRFSLERFKNKKLVYKLSADRMKWMPELEKWRVENYTIRTIDSLRETLQKGALLDTAIALTAADFDRRTNYKEAMTTPELQRFIAQERMKGAPFVEFYEVELYRRTAIPFATFILTVIGMAVASRKVRGGMGLHIAVGIGISAAYILFLQFSTTYATNGTLSPLISVWIPNFIFGVLAIYLLFKAQK